MRKALNNMTSPKLFLIALLVWFLLPTLALAEDEPPRAMTPAELAADSDVVVLVQLDRVNYEFRRGFPVKGSAWVKVLVRYKVPEPMDRIRIVEQGFGDDRCYFDEIPMWQEQPRYLMFLNRDEERDFRGHRDGCKLEVLVTRDNRYAVRWPQDALVLDEAGEQLVRELDFHGAGAFVDVSEMTSIRREDLQEKYYLEDVGDNNYRYTRGILLEDFRQLLGEENLTMDRQIRGR
ncbi:MAG: hypothetical protein ACNA7J_15140 [Wenzhouxiangella sp.]